MDANTVMLIRDIIAIITLPLILYRIWIIRTSIIQDHQRSRNEKAVDLIKEWTRIINHKSSASRKLVEKFDRETCRKLYKREKIDIEGNEQNIDLLKAIFDKDFTLTNEKIEINPSESTKLRWEVVTYLNILESVFIAYRHNVADKDILKEQFEYLVNPAENEFVLEDFRNSSRVHSYPGIQDFVDELKEDRKNTKSGRKKTGQL